MIGIVLPVEMLRVQMPVPVSDAMTVDARQIDVETRAAVVLALSPPPPPQARQ